MLKKNEHLKKPMKTNDGKLVRVGLTYYLVRRFHEAIKSYWPVFAKVRCSSICWDRARFGKLDVNAVSKNLINRTHNVVYRDKKKAIKRYIQELNKHIKALNEEEDVIIALLEMSKTNKSKAKAI